MYGAILVMNSVFSIYCTARQAEIFIRAYEIILKNINTDHIMCLHIALI